MMLFNDQTAARNGIYFWEMDLAGVAMEWWPTSAAAQPREGWMGAPTVERWLNSFAGEARARLAELLEKCAATDESCELELSLAAPPEQGSVTWVRVVCQAVSSGNGEAGKHLSGSIQNISAHHQKIEAIADELERRSQSWNAERQRFSEAQRIAKIGNWSFDLATAQIHWSAELYPLFGLDPRNGPPTYEQHRSQIHPDDVDGWTAHVTDCIVNGSPYDLECRAVLPGGEVIDILARGQANRDASGKIVSLNGVAQDITQRKRAERSFANERERVELAMRAGELGTWELDCETEICGLDERAREFLGFAPEQASMTVPEFAARIHSDDLRRVLGLVNAHIRGKTEYYEAQYRVQCGAPATWRWVMARGQAFERDGAGRALRIFGTVRDVHQARVQADLLAEAMQGAKEATAVKSQFLANMSHEIRTPMNGILGMTQLLLGSELTADQRQLLDDVDYSARSLLEIINGILDLSKVESGKLELYPVNFSLGEMLGRLMSVLQPTASDKGIQLSYEIAGNVPPVLLSDDVRLRQVLMNLLGNSLKFTGQQGLVTVRIEAGPAQASQELPLFFTVADTGIGIAPDKLETIFAPFTQEDNTTTRQFGGTGLGLAICRQLVQAMGGVISARNIDGGGSEFRFTVLAKVGNAHPFAPVAAWEDPQAGPALNGKPRLLLVEDNPVNQRLAKRLLEKLGCEVTLACDGREAVEKLINDASLYSLVMMDCQMPKLSGYDATREIRQWEQQSSDRHIPIVAMTANAMRGDQELCYEAGMDDYLSKPIDYRQLERVLSRFLQAYPSCPLPLQTVEKS